MSKERERLVRLLGGNIYEADILAIFDVVESEVKSLRAYKIGVENAVSEVGYYKP